MFRYPLIPDCYVLCTFAIFIILNLRFLSVFLRESCIHRFLIAHHFLFGCCKTVYQIGNHVDYLADAVLILDVDQACLSVFDQKHCAGGHLAAHTAHAAVFAGVLTRSAACARADSKRYIHKRDNDRIIDLCRFSNYSFRCENGFSPFTKASITEVILLSLFSAMLCFLLLAQYSDQPSDIFIE